MREYTSHELAVVVRRVAVDRHDSCLSRFPLLVREASQSHNPARILYGRVGADPGDKPKLRLSELGDGAPGDAPVALLLLDAIMHTTTGDQHSGAQPCAGYEGMQPFDLGAAVRIDVQCADRDDVALELALSIQLVRDEEGTGALPLHEGEEIAGTARLTVLRGLLALPNAAVQAAVAFDGEPYVVSAIVDGAEAELRSRIGVNRGQRLARFTKIGA